MNTGIGQVELLNVFDKLRLNDLTTELGSVDPEQVSAVFPLDPRWIEPGFVACTQASETMFNVVVDLAFSATTQYSGAQAIDDAQVQVWQSIVVHLERGDVTPISMALKIQNASGSNLQVARALLTNPGNLHVSGLLVPAGWSLSVTTSTNGGQYDYLSLYAYGFQVEPGVPCIQGGPVVTVTA